MKAFVRWVFFVSLAVFVFCLAWRVMMPSKTDWPSWRLLVGWMLVWFGCDMHGKRNPSAPVGKRLNRGRLSRSAVAK